MNAVSLPHRHSPAARNLTLGFPGFKTPGAQCTASPWTDSPGALFNRSISCGSQGGASAERRTRTTSVASCRAHLGSRRGTLISSSQVLVAWVFSSRQHTDGETEAQGGHCVHLQAPDGEGKMDLRPGPRGTLVMLEHLPVGR